MQKFILIFILFGLTSLACSNDSSDCCNALPEDIYGHWDIEGGGTLFFDEENFSASAGCNTLFGSITVEEETLVFSMIASTLIGCPEEEGNREQELAKLLDSAIFLYEIKEDTAYLLDVEENLIITLKRPENAALINQWKLSSIRVENGVTSSILDENTGLTFFADNTLSVQSACNSGQGSYSVQDKTLNIQELFFTEMGCEQERMTREQELSQALTQVNSYSILRKTLHLEKDGEVYLTLHLSE
jgi:heat shock protein HslJ